MRLWEGQNRPIAISDSGYWPNLIEQSSLEWPLIPRQAGIAHLAESFDDRTMGFAVLLPSEPTELQDFLTHYQGKR